MKTTFLSFLKKTAITTILGGASLCIVLLFSSCENFLKAQGTADVIQQAIDYANSTKYSIKVESEKGSGIVTKPAAGEALVKPSDIFNLSFSSESDSQFLKWEAYNALTNEPLEDETYLKIENSLMIDTTCTFVEDPEDENIQLAIRAVTAKRPRIIRATPVDQETGVPRNSTVCISFDKSNMNPDCIYYTEEEMQALKTELGLQDSDFLQGDNEHCNGRYYGYKKGDIHFFKNIQIGSSPVNGSSLTKYFYDPYWDNNLNDMGGSTLVIQTTNPPPPKDVVVYITLSKDFCYFEENIAVQLREANTISYKTMYENEFKSPEVFLNNQVEEPYNIIKFKDKDNKYKPLTYTWDSQRKPYTIQKCSDTQNIFMTFCFAATDEGGSCIANRFRLYCENVETASGQRPFIELPYSYFTSNKAYAGIEWSTQVEEWEDITEWSDDYACIIPRGSYLQKAQDYCFTIAAIDNDGNYHKLEDENKHVFYFWLTLTTAATID